MDGYIVIERPDEAARAKVPSAACEGMMGSVGERTGLKEGVKGFAKAEHGRAWVVVMDRPPQPGSQYWREVVKLSRQKIVGIVCVVVPAIALLSGRPFLFTQLKDHVDRAEGEILSGPLDLSIPGTFTWTVKQYDWSYRIFQRFF